MTLPCYIYAYSQIINIYKIKYMYLLIYLPISGDPVFKIILILVLLYTYII